MTSRTYYVYLLTNKNNTVLYTGVTNDLEFRIYQHKSRETKGFTKKYNLNKLVHFESTDAIDAAIAREKQIKGWTRKKKDALININNPKWDDLSKDWFDDFPPPSH